MYTSGWLNGAPAERISTATLLYAWIAGCWLIPRTRFHASHLPCSSTADENVRCMRRDSYVSGASPLVACLYRLYSKSRLLVDSSQTDRI